MHNHTPARLAIFAAVFASSSVFAEEHVTVAPVVVTASRTVQTADETLSSVSVITREQIENSGAQSLPDLLQRVQGVSFARSGPVGQDTSLFMRGTESDHVLLLVDGIKLGSATSGKAAFQHLPLEQIERIEVVRGPRSSIYGSEAIGGVIQIFTREDAPGASASAMAGGNDTGEVETSFTGGSDTTRYTVTARHFDTDGISARNDAFPDNDGYQNNSASINVSHNFSNTASWSLSALNSDGITEFDNCGFPGSSDCETEFTQQVVSTNVDAQVMPTWSITLTAGRSRDEASSFNDGSFNNEFDTERDEVSWQNDITIGTRNLLTLGLDYSDENVESTTNFTQSSRENEAVFGQWQWTGDRANFQTSVRHDDNEAFGEEDTGSIAAGYRIGDTTRVYGSFGTAFKAPTFNDLFFPFTDFGGGFTFEGNPDLEPESSESIEIGVEGGHDWRWSANVFRTEIEQLIVLTTSSVINLDQGNITGVELAANATRMGWNLNANLTLLDTEAETDDANDGNELPRRPERAVNIGARRDFGRTMFGVSARHESERFDEAANTTELDAFTVVDMMLGYRIDKDLMLRGELHNVFDTDYQTVDTFNMLDRTLFVRLSYQPR